MTTVALDAIECLPFMEDLENELTIEELSKVCDSLAPGKASSGDGNSPDLIGHWKIALLLPLPERRGRT